MRKKLLLSFLMMMLGIASSSAAITKQYGWFESAAAEWTAVSGASDYNVYVRPVGGTYTKIDKELVRKYADFYRADALGLSAGQYQMKVVPVNASHAEMTSQAMETGTLNVVAHDRSGFAHVGMTGGIGAYKNDGTLKTNTRVIYVTAKTAKTVTCNVMTDNDTEYTGLQAILAAFEKGKETRPLCIRIIGTLKASDMDGFSSSAEGIQVKGKNGSIDMNITIEGVGFDATTHGFGFLVRNAKSVEFRNFANMICMDDCLSLDTDNHNVWIHNMDFFYGGTGSASDQAKGDGTVDIKGKSSHVTLSYNHFYDSGKCSLGGMKSETTSCWMTYHHNWFDHSDSRHPRIRTAFYHCYNNYYDGNAKYGVGVTCGGSAFVEANYFRNTKYPMLISKQGTDAEGDGTFSGEPGGVNKAFNNIIINPRKVQYYDGSQTDGAWDAVLAGSRDEFVTAKAFSGGTSYNNDADEAARTSYIENKMDAPEDVPAIVRGELGAGRMEHGDFTWTFNNSLQDENYDVISDLKNALLDYESTVVSFADGTPISNRAPASSTIDSGDGKGLDQEANDAYVPTWAGGSGSTTIATGKQVIGEEDDWFWFNADNQAQVNAYMSDAADATVPNTITTNGTFNPTRTITNSKAGSCSDYTGSFLLPASGHLTMFYASGISTIAFYVSGNGSQKWVLEKSANGTSWTSVATMEGKTATHPAVVASFDESEGIKYVRITNKATGGRDVQGVKVYTPTGAADLEALNSNIALNQGATYKLTKGTDYTTTSTGAVTFKSSASKIASVDETTGVITGVAEGTAVITMTQAADESHNSATAKFNVTVNDARAASQLALTSNAEVTIQKGNTSNIAVTGAAGAVSYTSDAPSIATVSATGVITAVGYGSTTITVSDAGSSTQKSGKVTVKVNVPDNRTASTLSVASDDIIIDRNSTKQINVSGATGAVSFRSADEEIATVDANGVVTGVLAGETSIIVSDEGSNSVLPGTVSVNVTVNDPRAASQFTITSGTDIEIEMAVSATAAITTTGAAGTLTYESSDATIASVSSAGVITGKKAGTAEITVSDSGNDTYLPGTQTINVTVIPAPTEEPVTWIVSDASTLKSGTSMTNLTTAVFISTDESASELQYAVGSNCKIEVKNGSGTFKMGGATQYSSNVLSNRYFVLPALTGAGTLSVNYAADNKNDLLVKATTNKNDAALATITSANTSAHLTDLDNTVLYLASGSSKVYLISITWTPDVADTRPVSEFTLTSSEEVALAAGETSTITYEKAAGNVSFESSNDAVATVSAEGVITAVANGTATITVKDAGNTEYKGTTKTVNVTVTGGTDPQPGGGTAAKTWDFTQPLGSADLANLEADCEQLSAEGATTSKNWYKVSTTIDEESVARYGNGQVLAAKVSNANSAFVEIKANGATLELLKGIQWARYNNKLDVKSIRIDAGKRLNTNASNLVIKFPGLKKNDVIYIDYASASSTVENRTLTPTNGTGENLTTTSLTDRQLAKITVSADGDLEILQSKGMNYYKIWLNPSDEPTGIRDINAETKTVNGAVYDLMGRRVQTPVRGGLYIQNGKKFIRK